MKESIEWRSSTGDESTADGVYDVIMGLENVSPNSFLDVAKEKGYSTQLTPRISAIFWVAMSEAAGLRVRQQRIIRQYLAFHLGNRIAVSESDIAEVGSNFVPYISEDVVVDAKEYGVKSVKISYRGIDNLIINYADELFSDLNNIRRLEVILGGDHGKGILNFIVVFVIRYLIFFLQLFYLYFIFNNLR